MISEVKHGEKITANWANQLVGACNGEFIPDNGVFTKTSNGVINNSILNNDSFNSVYKCPVLFEVKQVVQPEISSVNEMPLSSAVPKNYFHIYVGKDIESLKSHIKIEDNSVDKVVVAPLSGFQYELSNEVIQGFKPGVEIDQHNNFYDGWINTGMISADKIIGVFLAAKKEGTNEEGETVISTDSIFAITEQLSGLSARVNEIFDDDYISIIPTGNVDIAEFTHQSRFRISQDDASPDFSFLYQTHLGGINLKQKTYQFPWEYEAFDNTWRNPTYQIGTVSFMCTKYAEDPNYPNNVTDISYSLSGDPFEVSAVHLPALSGTNYLIVDPSNLSAYIINDLKIISAYIKEGYWTSIPIGNVLSGQASYFNRYPQVLCWEAYTFD